MADDDAERTDPQPVVTALSVAVRGASSGLAPGQVVGRYQIVRLLGAGGMGEVYLATDDPLKREVAIKIVRSGAFGADRDHIARDHLLREAQAMAKVAHPNVVVVFDAGLVDGQVYVAMEHVAGTTLRGWIEGHARSSQQILRMYIAAGRGLAALHAAEIVHRDIKPDNILVGVDGRPRVGDFGLAVPEPERARGDDAELTRYSGIHGGTPRYMAPEQHDASAIDARSDQYSFSVALWEALAGAAPFPSTNLAALLEQKRAGIPSETAAFRNLPSGIRSALRRGLAMRPDDRWPSMDALLAALERPAIRRNRVVAATAIIGLGCAVGGAGILVYRSAHPDATPCGDLERALDGTWDPTVAGAMKTRFAASTRANANAAYERAFTGLEAYTSSWVAMRRDACLATAVRKEQPEAARDLRMACLDRRADELRALTSVFATSVDDTTIDRAVSAVNDLRPVSTCASATTLAEVPVPTAAQVPVVAALRARVDAIKAQTRAGHYKMAIADARSVTADAVKSGFAPLEAEALEALGGLEAILHEVAPAEQHFHEALAAAALAHDDTTISTVWRGLIASANERARYDEASERFDFALAAMARAGNPPLALSKLLLAGGEMKVKKGKYAEAIELNDRALALQRQGKASALDRASALDARGTALRSADRMPEALAAFQEALALWESALGPDHPSVAGVLQNLGNAERILGHLDRGERDLRRALELNEKIYGTDHVNVARVANLLCELLAQAEKVDDAVPLCERALAIKLKASGPDSREIVGPMVNLANIANNRGDYATERTYRERVFAIHTKVLDADHPTLGIDNAELGDLALAQGNVDAAKKRFDAALAIFIKVNDPIQIASMTGKLAEVALAQHHLGPALEGARAALAGHEKTSPDDPITLSGDHTLIGLVLEDQHDYAAARRELEAAVSILEPVVPANSISLTPALTALGHVLIADHKGTDAMAPLRRVTDILGPLSYGRIEYAIAGLLLAEATWSAGDHLRALDLARTSLALLAKAQTTAEVTEARTRGMAWLAAHAR